MNWNAVGAIAEVLGAVGVIVSLLYLAIQVRQGTKVAKAATRQALAGGLQALASDLVNVPMSPAFFRPISRAKLWSPTRCFGSRPVPTVTSGSWTLYAESFQAEVESLLGESLNAAPASLLFDTRPPQVENDQDSAG